MNRYVQKAEEEIGEKNRKRKDGRGISTQEILEVKESIWEKRVQKNAHQKAIEPCNRIEREICAKEGKDIIDLTSLFCSKEQ